MNLKFIFITILFITSAQAGTFKTKFYCQNGDFVKCLIDPSVHECEFTGKKCEDTVFNSRGAGYYCYQEYEDALIDAQNAVFYNADKVCAPEKAFRVSILEHLSGGRCTVRLSANFVCN